MELEQVMQALRNAHAAGDTEAARRFAAMAQNLKGQQSQVQPVAEPPAWVQEQAQALAAAQPEPGALVQNIFGYGEADTPGERLGRVIQATGAGAGRGAEGLLNLPGDLMRLAENAAIRPAYNALAPESMQVPQDVSAFPPRVETGIGEFQPQSTLEEYAGTVGEFLPGAALVPAGNVGLLGRIGRFGVVPGVASEAAGQATEGTAAEPYARMAAGLMAGMAAAPRPTEFGRGVLGRGDEEAQDLANYLMERGVTPTAGQASANRALMRAEGMVEPSAQQLDDFTAAALRTMGVDDATRATATTLEAGQARIVDAMEDIVGSVDVPITPEIGRRAMTVHDDFFAGTPGAELPNRLRNIADELIDAATNPQGASIPASRLREWRTALGRYTTSKDEMVRDAAHELRNVIDNGTEAALSAAGRFDDVARLSELRTQYRNFRYIVGAVGGSGPLAARGILTPARIQSETSRVRDALSYATGRGTELANLGKAGSGVLETIPAVAADAMRRPPLGTSLAAGLGGLGGFAGYNSGGLLGAVTGGLAAGAAGLLIPPALRGIVRSGFVQSAAAQPSNLAPGAVAGLLGGMAQ